ncbi:MAG: flavin reductase family protein [Alphaproteobacteria bacterium]
MQFEPPHPNGLKLRASFGKFATGVTIVSAISKAGKPVGFTANSFTSVSLDPALLLVAIGKDNKLHEVFETAAHFAISILQQNQQTISNQFANPNGMRFEALENDGGLSPYIGPFGLPLIPDALAWFCCESERVIEAGDHSLLIGKILQHGEAQASNAPLIYWNGQYL